MEVPETMLETAEKLPDPKMETEKQTDKDVEAKDKQPDAKMERVKKQPDIEVETKEKKSQTGIAAIKQEFLVLDHVRKLALDHVSENDKRKIDQEETEIRKVENDLNDVQAFKKLKVSSRDKKKLKGQNKNRPRPVRPPRDGKLCPSIIDLAEGETQKACLHENCTFQHDVQDYLANKPPDIASECWIYSISGRCPRGLSCRFGSQHISPEGRNVVNAELWEKSKNVSSVLNSLTKDLQHQLWKRKYDFTRSESFVKKFSCSPKRGSNAGTNWRNKEVVEEEESIPPDEEVPLNGCDGETLNSEVPIESGQVETESVGECEAIIENNEDSSVVKSSGAITDEDIIRTRKSEKTVIDWRDKLYLSPLTTVGNLPFRRICKEFGADVTCGEMALAVSLLHGTKQEWALVKRHESEDLFGVQLCGNNPYVMAKCAQLLEEQASVSFIDVNLGCPIDLVYQQGSGSGLLRRERALQSVIRCMTQVLTIPVTVKTRTGVSSDKNLAHILIPQFKKWGVSLVTLHGRSREQRYTRSSDWTYIEQCARLAAPMPLFGNGDILSFEDYYGHREATSVAGCMIGRGALYKPWIFTEIKEQRHWDISSGERMDILKKYVRYGLEHWGSDTQGVENTRRFLLEWLSFLHRYIPVGILERPPQKINERPPFYIGRNDLETLMASPSCSDWIKISEMLLGPVPEDFIFLPKHKANSWK